MTLRDNMRRWLGVDALEANTSAVYGKNCELTGQHFFEARFDEEPGLILDTADIIAFQGSNAVNEERYSRGELKRLISKVIPAIDITDQINMVEAHKKKIYLGDCCRHCGKFVRFERR